MTDPLRTLEARGTLDPLLWAKRWTPEAVPAAYADHHRRLCELPDPGHSQLRSVWRGSAKTTITRLWLSWLCEQRSIRGAVLVRATFADCKADQTALINICRQRGMPYQTDGEQRLLIVNGVPIWLRTPGAAIRGANWSSDTGQVIRPDLLVIDDLETRESARSKMQTDAIRTWLFSDAMQCGEQAHPMRTVMLGTPITPTCLVSQAMRREAPFDVWDPPLVVPMMSPDGAPAWPAMYDATLRDRIPPLTLATEYDLQPLPEGTLMFPPSKTGWAESPVHRNVVVGIDPAAGGDDSTGMTAMTMTPRGLHIVDAAKWDGPHTGLVDAVARFVDVNNQGRANVVQVAVEAVGAWKFVADAVAVAVAPILTTQEKPVDSKIDRALKLTRWHAAGAVTADPKLRGSDWDLEFHSFTQEGLTITGHDDCTDATGWAAAVLTAAYTVQPPAPQTVGAA